MRVRVLLGIVALFPAALNTSPAAAAGMMLVVPVCTGDGQIRTVSLPGGAQDLPGKQGSGCCAKGCHSGGSRKRGDRAGGAER